MLAIKHMKQAIPKFSEFLVPWSNCNNILCAKKNTYLLHLVEVLPVPNLHG